MDAPRLKRALLALAGALQGIRLYPHRHPVVRQQLEACLTALLDLLQLQPRIKLVAVDETLFFEDLPLVEHTPAAEELRERLGQLRLHGLEFTTGLSAGELYDALDLLAAGTCSGDAFEEALTVRGVLRIRAVRIAADEDEGPLANRIYRRALGVVERVCNDVRLGRIPSTVETLEVVREMVQQTLAQPHSLFALTMLKDYDNYTFQHSVNVAVIAMTVGRACGVTNDRLQLLALGGLLHDLGKLTVPIEIINKPGQLTPAEYKEVMLHPATGAAIAEQMEAVPAEALDIIRGHHLRYDRSGYPADARGLPLSELADMAAIADCFDAMTTLRVYQRPITVREALKGMQQAAGNKLHPDFLRRFIRFIGPYPAGSLVRLTTNEIGLVTEVHGGDAREIELKILFGADGRPLPVPEKRLLGGRSSEQVVAEVDPFIKGVHIPDYLD